MEVTIEQIAEAFEEFKNANNTRWDKMANRMNAEKARADALEATIKRINKYGTGGDDPHSGGTRAEVKALGDYVARGDDSSLMELKGMSVDSQPDGGYFVVPVLDSEIYAAARDVSPLRRLADVRTINTDAWEQILNTGRSDTAWVAEREARPVGENAKLKLIRIPLHENYANIPVTQKLLDLGGHDAGEFVLQETGLAFGEDEAVEFVAGDGVKKPRGFLTYPTSTDADATREWGTVQEVKTGADGAFATPSATVSPADVLVDTLYSLRAAYRRNATWLMNSLTAAAVRKFKDAEGRYVWRDSLQDGQPPTLLGRPVEIEENMPDITTDSLSIALADWRRAYVVVSRPGIKTLRDPFTAKPNVLFYSYVRVGGGLRDSRALKLVRFGD